MKHIHLFAACMALCITAFSNGQKDAVNKEHTDTMVSLDQEEAVMEVGETFELRPTWGASGYTARGDYSWTSDNPSVVSITTNEQFVATLAALKEGATTVTITSVDDPVLTASCEIVVEPAADGTLRVLAIGNSFSADALETHFSAIAQAAGVPVIVANMAIAGASLDMHVANLESNANAYIYTRIDADGQVTRTTDVALAGVLSAEHWDFISLQQVSSNSGLYETFQANLPKLLEQVKEKVVNKRVTYVLHQTWAYAADATHLGFVNYDNNQLQMYAAIVDTYNRAAELVDIEVIIPAGTAIQNARTTILGDEFTTDGSHLTHGLGRYIAAATWFEKLTGEAIIGNTYSPQSLNDYQRELGQHAAHLAVCKPGEVTEMVDFQQPGTEVTTQLDASNNVNNIACANGGEPDADGVTTLRITMGDNNDNSTGFYDIGAVQIKQGAE